MPELPEVETIRRGLAPALKGHILSRVQTRRDDLRIPFPPRFAQKLSGRRVIRLDRRAKYLLAHLDGGETLIMHMGMSGYFTLHAPAFMRRSGTKEDSANGSGHGPHDHVVFTTDEGVRIVYTDHRRFGLMILAKTDTLASHRLFAGLGPEPLDSAFTARTLGAALKDKRTPIKAALLDQKIIAGLGNIYVCEALYRARISPKRSAASVAGGASVAGAASVVGKRAARLVPAIKKVLREAISAGGSTLRDYKRADGELGTFQHRFAVYGRAGEPCRTKGCKSVVKRIVQAGRSTFYCSTCQR